MRNLFVGLFGRVLVVLTILFLSGISIHAEERSVDEDWIVLFDGKSLDGWTPKFRGAPLGENVLDTFRVEDGILKVSYDDYDQFDARFGHLFYKQPFSSYILRMEYRFVGEQMPDGPPWNYRNSGVMIHSQSPESMELGQDFPVSIEVQFLGGDGENARTTANICSPGTHIVLNGELHQPHETPSTSKTFHGDQWVSIEVEVRGGEKIVHRVNGETVIEYTEPQIEPRYRYSRALMKDRDSVLLTEGYIALQAESHPVHFRSIRLLPLEE